MIEYKYLVYKLFQADAYIRLTLPYPFETLTDKLLRLRGRAFLARCRRSATSLRDAVLPPYPLEPLRASRRSLPYGPPTARQARRVAHANGATSTARVCGQGVSERTIRRDRPFRCGTAHREALKLNAALITRATTRPARSTPPPRTSS